MKRLLYILLFLILATSWCGSLWAQTTQPKQLSDVTTTEGREFFVAWLPNGGSLPTDADLKLQLIASTRHSNSIKVEYPSGRTDGPYILIPGQSHVITVDPAEVYWNFTAGEEQRPLNKGIRVYSSSNEKFTLYSINQCGTEAQGTLCFDGAHILPVEALGNEYIVQTAEADEMATEFVVMSTKPGVTTVTLDLKVSSRNPVPQPMTITLNGPKQIYIVRSKAPDPEAPNDIIDLSGSTICADQPIAVWSGNQVASIPNQNANTKDHAYDQLLPVTKWGMKFLVPMTGLYTQYNEVHVTALNDNTNVSITNQRGARSTTSSITLPAQGDSVFVVKAPLAGNLDNMAMYIEADKPIQVYLHSSAGAANPYDDIDGVRHLQGDPSMTIIPPLEYLTDTTIFATYNGGDGNLTHEMRLWAKTANVGSIRMNGNSIASSFSPSNIAPGYSTAKIPINPTQGTSYTITAPEKCFSGYVYGMNDGQTYLYTVGYDFTPQPDSLFLLDNGPQYTVHESEWQEHAVSATERRCKMTVPIC